MPFGGRLLAAGVAFLFINWLLEGKFKHKLLNINYPRLTLSFISLYFIYLISMIYTSNQELGWSDLETKLSILVCPLAFLISRDFNPITIRRTLISFLLGCGLSFITCIIIAFFSDQPKEAAFFYSQLSYFIHAGYYSMYLAFAIGIVLMFISGRYYKNTLQLIGWIALILFFLAAQVMLSAKNGLIASSIIFLLSAGYIILEKKKVLLGLSIVLLDAMFLIALVKGPAMIGERFKTMEQVSNMEQIDKKTNESSGVRLLIWEASLDVIKENYLTGVGAGDDDNALTEKYQAKGMTGALEKHLNAHNQYLQTFISVGIVGFSVLMIGLIVPLLYSYRSKKYLYTIFLIIIMIGFLTESVLETQGGVIFYAFFNSLLLASKDIFAVNKDNYDLASRIQ